MRNKCAQEPLPPSESARYGIAASGAALRAPRRVAAALLLWGREKQQLELGCGGRLVAARWNGTREPSGFAAIKAKLLQRKKPLAKKYNLH